MNLEVQQKSLEQELAKLWEHVPTYEGKEEETNTDYTCLAAQVEELTSQLSELRCSETSSATNGTASEKLQNFITNNGGLTGGWRSDDHTLFLRLLSTHCPGTSLVPELTKLTGKNSHEIEEHLRWYRKYCGLRREQKAELELWKKKRDQEKVKGRGQAKQDLQEIQRRNSESVKSWLAHWQAERMIKKREIEKWRRARFELMVRREEEQQARRAKELEQKRLLLKDKAERALACQLAKKKRTEEAGISEKARQFMTSLEKWERSRSANARVKQFGRRDVEKAAAKAQERARAASASPEPRLSTKVLAPKDPTRLLLPTKAFLYHQIAAESDPLWKPPVLWKEMPKRSTPAWRRMLS